jgi:lysophospholipase L1-like esterase
MIKNIKWLLLVSISFVACNKTDDEVTTEVPVTAGSANFSKYVALGDSFAAGYSDGALFKKAQETAYPNIIAGQLAQAGGGAFTTPFMADNFGGLLLGGTPIQGTRLYFNGTIPVNAAGVPSTEVTTKLTGSYSNMGVPGAKSFHLIAPGYGSAAGVPTLTANPYYVRFASSATSTVLEDGVAQNASFFSLWIGGNDVLGYALSGGDDSNPITPTATFDYAYNKLATDLSAGGKKGVIANLPYINTLPFFTTVPYNPLTSSVLGGGSVPVGEATINALNQQLYGPLKSALTAFGAGDRINLLSTTGGNPLLIKDESLSNLSAQLTAAFTPTLGAATAGFYGAVFGQARQATAMDYVLLTTRGLIAVAPTADNSGIGAIPPAPLNKFGITFPLQDKHVLIATEITDLKTATDAYNLTIKATAESKGLAFVDAKAIMDQLVSKNGIVANNYTLKADFVTGGAFSLDGIHPSPRGYALIANKFIEAINAKYASTLKTVNIGDYRVLFPASL